MKIYVGADHAGFDLKNIICTYLLECGYEVIDKSDETANANDDYNDFALKVSSEVGNNNDSLGILLCGTGIGISISANKQKGIRAALCHTELEAKLAKMHNNANVLCLGGRIIGSEQAKSIADVFIKTPFSNEERHIKRAERLNV